ncbi:hypothetical protein [Actinoplanes auranticolor]|uniref:Uncharacterized protein n=1 Tax=Actinoplanes auranticolor TaxID=47988 RepID=A0A919VZV1_9ACTN|nr:hypothetical protein [Actinoplanes auranticolor]GIM74983.1 hypothetical protein Aau02nite_63690 [Actinoplanes auranticolor]
MHPELAAALAPILTDLGRPEGVLPEIRDKEWNDLPATASAYLFAQDGSGQGISVALGQPFHHQVAELADRVQDWAVEALWSLGRPTNWPPCPRHPQSHPLAAVESQERAVWRCPADNVEIAAIGGL